MSYLLVQQKSAFNTSYSFCNWIKFGCLREIFEPRLSDVQSFQESIREESGKVWKGKNGKRT